jgi:hypothetical protein
MYDGLCKAGSQKVALLQILESAYPVRAKEANWDVDAFDAGLAD